MFWWSWIYNLSGKRNGEGHLAFKVCVCVGLVLLTTHLVYSKPTGVCGVLNRGLLSGREHNFEWCPTRLLRLSTGPYSDAAKRLADALRLMVRVLACDARIGK